ncbi:M56 family metallopeptidase [bacterium]|nr:M56 family metallopeptidase [bacterium]
MTSTQIFSVLDAFGYHTIRLLISVAWQSSLLIAAVALIVFMLRRQSAAVRHVFWAVLLCSLPVIPLLVWTTSILKTPKAEITIIPAYTAPSMRQPDGFVIEPSISTGAETDKNGSTGTFPFKPGDYPWALGLAIYALGAVFFLVWMAIGRLCIWRWKRTGVVLTDRRVIDTFLTARERLGIRRGFTVIENPEVPAPLTAGTFHPVVLVPAGFTDGLTDEELSALAVHELTHVKRNDALVFSVVSVVRALFFFHPLVWLATDQVVVLAEHACDEAVLDSVSEPFVYIEMLVGLASNRSRRRFVTEMAAGFVISKHAFLRRVEVMLSDKGKRIRSLSRGFLAGTVIVAVLSVMVTCALPIGEKKQAGKQAAQVCGFMNEPDDTITEFIGGKAQEIDPHELGGVVYDESGKPLEGALVDAWTWYTHDGHEVYTDAQGKFRLKNLSRDNRVEVRFSKEGYSPELIIMQKTGVSNIIVRLGNKTYFEGRVLAPDGRPVPDALIRASQGPKRAHGVVITSIWTETRSGRDGRYRLYVEADTYDIQVRVPGTGGARLQGEVIDRNKSKNLDITLAKGVTFRAQVVNSRSGKPVEGLRLYNWQKKDIEGISDKNGALEIMDMLPGPFEFNVEGKGYARWWSEEASKEWERKMISSRTGWQRNFDDLEFDLQLNMKPVTIFVEDAVTITGRVLDPDGRPVAGATVAPAHTGSGNSITGDTRYSVPTNDDGTFEMILPASGDTEYNLVAHDGKYTEWRTWANGIKEPIKTQPGQVIRDVTISLTQPATVTGTVVDEDGKPLAHHEVRASATDKLENRYYDPTTRTDDKGNFTLKYIRPGSQFIQAAPFWLSAEEAPYGSTVTLYLSAGTVKDGVQLVGNVKKK